MADEKNYYIGIDLGTGSVKTVLFDQDGNEIAQLAEEYPLYSPKNGYSEQEPEDWYQAAMKTMKYVLDESGIDRSKVKGIGFSGQMMGAVVLDENGEPLRRAILWNDARTMEACKELSEIVGDDVFMKYTCGPARPGFQLQESTGLRRMNLKFMKRSDTFSYQKITCVTA